MELSASLLSAVSKPTFLLWHPNLETLSQNAAHGTEAASSAEWVEALCSAPSQWRIDGSNMLGRQLYAVPTQITDLVPLRIDVYLPDQSQIPRELRKALESSRSVVLRSGPDIDKLGISRLVCKALDAHCREHTEFWDEYRKLPFGSCLIFNEVKADPKTMELTIQPAYDLERQTKSLRILQETWNDRIPKEAWPPAIDLNELRLLRQLHDSVSLVQIPAKGQQEYVFKTSVSDMMLVYHELRFLLECPPHPNIIEKPLYIVTKRSAFGGKSGVYGFILPYFASGSLRDLLPEFRLRGELSPERQLKWGKQVTSALIHIQRVCDTFYSDLRPDNVVLSEHDDLILIDFEQRGNWYEWCPPEVRFRMYVEHLRSSKISSPTHRIGPGLKCVEDLLRAFDDEGSRSSSLRRCAIDGPVPALTARNEPWYALTSIAQERAMIYSLGLMLFCIFEGTCNPNISLTNEWAIEPHIEFPSFVRTPDVVQALIKRCTSDAPEWLSQNEGVFKGAKRFTRRGDKLVIASNGCTVQSEVLKETERAWIEEAETATMFFQTDKWLSGQVGAERPSLKQVLQMLQEIEDTVFHKSAATSITSASLQGINDNLSNG